VAGFVPGEAGEFLRHPPLRVLWDGSAAVMLFFALSGFVLSLPFTGEDSSIQPIGFLIRRIARLYPAYWAALILALALRSLVLGHGPLLGVSPWADSLWSDPVSPSTLVKHFLMIAPGIDTHAIDPVIWSLVIEMKVSIVFPLILVLVRNTARPGIALLVMTASLSASAYLRSLDVLPIFLGASYLAKYRLPLETWITGLPLVGKTCLFASGVFLYGTSSFLGKGSLRTILANGFGACLLLLMFLAWKPLAKFASSRPVHFLGRVSYSFYLVHLPILLLVYALLLPAVKSMAVCALVSLLCSLLVAEAMYRVIESPAQDLGRRLSTTRTVSAEFPAISRPPD